MHDRAGSFTAIRTCLRLLPRRLQLGWLAIAALQASCAAVELLAAAALFWGVSALVDPARAAALPISAGAALAAGALAVAALFLLKNLWLASAHLAQTWLLSASLTAAFRTLVAAWLAAPFALHDEARTGDLVHDATEGIGVALRGVLGSASAVLAEVLVAGALGAFLAAKAPAPVAAVGLLLALLLTVLLTATRRLSHRWGERGFALGRQVVGDLGALGAGLREIKAFRAERSFLDAAIAHHREAMGAFRGHTGLAGMPRLLIESAFVLAAVAVVIAGIGSGRDLTAALPLLALFAYTGLRLVPSANRIVVGLEQVRHGAAGIALLAADLRRLGQGEPDCEVPPRRALPGAIELDEVAYRHPTATRPALHRLSLRIAPGERIGLVGATGAGKSTLIDLLAGLLEPCEGHLRVGEERLADWLRRGGAMGYVPQVPWLLDATVAANVAFGVPAERIDRAWVEEVLAAACLEEVVRALPAGIDEPLGEGGLRLSGGERQRLAIARALYDRPDLLLLDEATSALDAGTEARLLDRLWARGATVVIAAHRLHALRRCDWLVLLDHGVARASGTWDELFRDLADFRRLAAHAPPERWRERVATSLR